MGEKTIHTIIRFGATHYKYLFFVLALLVGLVFNFLIIPTFGINLGYNLDPDGYGKLGQGLYYNLTLSFYPDESPTVNRGPIYPLFIALCLLLSSGWYPYSVQLAQIILFSLTCILVTIIAEQLWNRRVAFLSGFIYIFNPFLVWYTARIWIETLAIFLFTLMIFLIIRFYKNSNIKNSIALGIVIGVSSLYKETFLPFILIIPIMFLLMKLEISKKYLLISFLSATLIVVPWTIRNYVLTQKLFRFICLLDSTCKWEMVLLNITFLLLYRTRNYGLKQKCEYIVQ